MTALTLLVLLCGPAAAARDAAPEPAARGRQLTLERARMAVAAPKGWRVEYDARPGTSTLYFAIDLTGGPRGKPYSAVTIGARFFAAGHRDFKSARDFVDRQTKESWLPRPPGHKTYGMKEAKLVGLAGWEFRRDTEVMLPPDSMKMKAHAKREEVVVLQAPDGFYVLTYFAPRELFDEYYQRFRAVRKSFRRLAQGEPAKKTPAK